MNKHIPRPVTARSCTWPDCGCINVPIKCLLQPPQEAIDHQGRPMTYWGGMVLCGALAFGIGFACGVFSVGAGWMK